MKRKLGLKRFVFLMGTLVFAVAFSGCASAKIEKQSISPLAIITVGHHIFDESERPQPMGQIPHDQQGAGRRHLSVDFRYNHMVIGIF